MDKKIDVVMGMSLLLGLGLVLLFFISALYGDVTAKVMVGIGAWMMAIPLIYASFGGKEDEKHGN